MTMTYSVQIGRPLSKEEHQEVEGIILSTFYTVNQCVNDWNPKSEISLLNQLPAHTPITLSDELATFLSRVEELVVLTEGRFDPSVAPLHKVWKKALQKGELPEEEALTKARSVSGWDNIHLQHNLFWKEHTETALDLGGVAKGYAVDLLAQHLSDAGYQDIFVEWGGEVKTLGKHPRGRPWKVGIRGHLPVEMQSNAIATSGTYFQNWKVEGKSYAHILDPQSGRPLEGSPLTSVSVIAPSCLEADALATALMLFPTKEEAERWGKERGINTIIW